MKNLILIFTIITFTGTTVKAQEFVFFGAKGGLNRTNMSSDNFSDSKSRTGFHLGLLAEIHLGKKFSLQPEILYSTQGAEADVFMDGSGPNQTEYDLDYVQVPVLAKIYLSESLSIEAGPSFNFLVNEKIDGEDAEFGSGFNLGGALGASYKFRSGFFGGVRYMYGFTDAFDTGSFGRNTNNTGFQLGIGFMF